MKYFLRNVLRIEFSLHSFFILSVFFTKMCISDNAASRRHSGSQSCTTLRSIVDSSSSNHVSAREALWDSRGIRSVEKERFLGELLVSSG